MADVIYLDDYRPAVVLTEGQETRAKLGHEIVEALRDNVKLERAVQAHLLALHHTLDDVVA